MGIPYPETGQSFGIDQGRNKARARIKLASGTCPNQARIRHVPELTLREARPAAVLLRAGEPLRRLDSPRYCGTLRYGATALANGPGHPARILVSKNCGRDARAPRLFVPQCHHRIENPRIENRKLEI